MHVHLGLWSVVTTEVEMLYNAPLIFFLQLFIYFLEWGGGGLHGLKIIIIDFSADDTCFLKEFFEVNIANHEISAVSVRHVIYPLFVPLSTQGICLRNKF